MIVKRHLFVNELDPSGKTRCMGVRAKINRVLKLKNSRGIDKTIG